MQINQIISIEKGYDDWNSNQKRSGISNVFRVFTEKCFSRC